MVGSTSFTPATPALRSFPRLVQSAMLPVTAFGPAGLPFASHLWSSVPGVVSLPIWTSSSR